VLAGGLSIEREVSLRSGTRVAHALADAGYDVDVLDVGADVMTDLRSRVPDAVWPVLHGAAGEDGSLAELLRMLDLVTVGTAPDGCRLSWDKSVAAAIAATLGIAVPTAVTIPVAMLRDIGTRHLVPAIAGAVGPAVVVKPNRGGSGFGISAIAGADDLPEAMMLAFGHDSVCRVERLVTGVEVAVTVIDTGHGPGALPAVEIAPCGGDYDFRARYTVGATEFNSPARLEAAVADRLAGHAVDVHRAMGLGSLSRSDWIVDDGGVPWFLEVNTSPGMTDTSTTPLAMTADGTTLAQACSELVEAATALPWRAPALADGSPLG